MGSELESFIQNILQNAEKEAQRILEEARQEARRIIEEAEQRARREAEKRAKEIIESERSRIFDEELRKIRREKAELKGKILEKLRNKLREEIKTKVRTSIEEINYGDILYRLIREAVLELGVDKLIISANPRDLEFIKSRLRDIKRKIKEDIGVDIDITFGDKIDVIGGIIARTPSGDKVYNATLDALVEQAISKNITKIARRLGLISQNRFRRLIHKLFSKINRPLEIEDSGGNKVVLHPCKNIYLITTEHGRIDLVCEADNAITLVYATLGRATAKKIEEFTSIVNSQFVDKNPQKVFIAFSGSDKESEGLLRKNNILLLTKKELFRIDREINAGIFE